MRAQRRFLVPTALTALAAPDPDDPALDYLSEDQLRDLGIDPDLIPVLAPHATELRALDGARCWARADLVHLLDSEGDTP